MAQGETKKSRKGDGIYQRGSVWYLDCRIKGQRYVTKLGRGFSRTVAVELATIERTKIYRGEAGTLKKKQKDLTFEAAATAFLTRAETELRPRTFLTYKECCGRLRVSFAGMRLSQITTWLVQKHRQARIDGGAKIRANREVSCLKNLFNFCLRMKLYEGENPTHGVRLPKEPLTKIRFLDHDEEARLLQALHEPLRTLVMLGIHTGIRIQSEGVGLQWEHVDLKRNFVTVPAHLAKNGCERVISLNQKIRTALSDLSKDAKHAHIFVSGDGLPYRHIRKSFDRACERAKVFGVTPHVLRHTFGSWLVAAGENVRTVQELGGWKSLDMVMRYSHLSPQHKAQAVEALCAPPVSETDDTVTTLGGEAKAQRLVSA